VLYPSLTGSDPTTRYVAQDARSIHPTPIRHSRNHYALESLYGSVQPSHILRQGVHNLAGEHFTVLSG
jgi:hypothetical protein